MEGRYCFAPYNLPSTACELFSQPYLYGMPALSVLLPLLLMAAAIAAALSIGGLFFFKKSGERRANRLYGTLLLLAGLTQLHFALDFSGWLASYPWMRYLPIYFSLWLPVLLFSHVKISLYPSYNFRCRTDDVFPCDLAHAFFAARSWAVFLQPFLWRAGASFIPNGVASLRTL